MLSLLGIRSNPFHCAVHNRVGQIPLNHPGLHVDRRRGPSERRSTNLTNRRGQAVTIRRNHLDFTDRYQTSALHMLPRQHRCLDPVPDLQLL